MAVADVLISKVLDLLASFTVVEIEEHVKLVGGVKEDLQMLTNTLRSVQAVLVDAEQRQLQEEAVRLWVDRLKDISYDIDDVLDEWNTKIMKSDGILKPKKTKYSNYPSSIAALSFCRDGRLLAVASSYPFEEGDKPHEPDAIFVRCVNEIEVKPKPKVLLNPPA